MSALDNVSPMLREAAEMHCICSFTDSAVYGLPHRPGLHRFRPQGHSSENRYSGGVVHPLTESDRPERYADELFFQLLTLSRPDINYASIPAGHSSPRNAPQLIAHLSR